jgi:hypothetical protein
MELWNAVDFHIVTAKGTLSIAFDRIKSKGKKSIFASMKDGSNGYDMVLMDVSAFSQSITQIGYRPLDLSSSRPPVGASVLMVAHDPDTNKVSLSAGVLRSYDKDAAGVTAVTSISTKPGHCGSPVFCQFGNKLCVFAHHELGGRAANEHRVHEWDLKAFSPFQ